MAKFAISRAFQRAAVFLMYAMAVQAVDFHAAAGEDFHAVSVSEAGGFGESETGPHSCRISFRLRGPLHAGDDEGKNWLDDATFTEGVKRGFFHELMRRRLGSETFLGEIEADTDRIQTNFQKHDTTVTDSDTTMKLELSERRRSLNSVTYEDLNSADNPPSVMIPPAPVKSRSGESTDGKISDGQSGFLDRTRELTGENSNEITINVDVPVDDQSDTVTTVTMTTNGTTVLDELLATQFEEELKENNITYMISQPVIVETTVIINNHYYYGETTTTVDPGNVTSVNTTAPTTTTTQTAAVNATPDFAENNFFNDDTEDPKRDYTVFEKEFWEGSFMGVMVTAYIVLHVSLCLLIVNNVRKPDLEGKVAP